MALRRVWLWLAMACAILAVGQEMTRAAAPRARMAVITRLRRGQWPVVDGRFGDPAWQGIRPLTAFVPLGAGGSKAKAETVAWVTYDDARLYLFFRCREPRPEEMRSVGERRDESVGEGDSLHLFIATADLPDPSFYLALNPKNIRWDAFCNGETIEPAIDCEWESAVVTGKKEWCARRDPVVGAAPGAAASGHEDPCESRAAAYSRRRAHYVVARGRAVPRAGALRHLGASVARLTAGSPAGYSSPCGSCVHRGAPRRAAWRRRRSSRRGYTPGGSPSALGGRRGVPGRSG